MYTPRFRKKRTGVPVLSKNDIDIIGEQFVADFCPEAVKTPMEIDIDRFAQSYLDLHQDFQYLSHNGIYLGMMIFNDTDRVVIYDPKTKRAEYIRAKARTVIIDSGLLNEKQEHRYRFTMGHEAAHDIFHSGYYAYKPNEMNLVDAGNAPLVQCRIDSTLLSKKRIAYWKDSDWMEWQADNFSSSILMPVSMIKRIAKTHQPEQSAFKAACCVHSVSRTFNVSYQAAEIRLRGLGYLKGFSKKAINEELSIFAC